MQIFTGRRRKKFEADAVVDAFHADSDRGGDGHRASARLSSPLNDSLRRRSALPTPGDRRSPRPRSLSGRGPFARRCLRPDSLAGCTRPQHRSRTPGRSRGRWANAITEKSGRRRLYESDTGVDRDHSSLTWTADWSASGNWPAKSIQRYVSSRSSGDDQRAYQRRGCTDGPIRRRSRG